MGVRLKRPRALTSAPRSISARAVGTWPPAAASSSAVSPLASAASTSICAWVGRGGGKCVSVGAHRRGAAGGGRWRRTTTRPLHLKLGQEAADVVHLAIKGSLAELRLVCASLLLLPPLLLLGLERVDETEAGVAAWPAWAWGTAAVWRGAHLDALALLLLLSAHNAQPGLALQRGDLRFVGLTLCLLPRQLAPQQPAPRDALQLSWRHNGGERRLDRLLGALWSWIESKTWRLALGEMGGRQLARCVCIGVCDENKGASVLFPSFFSSAIQAANTAHSTARSKLAAATGEAASHKK